MAREFLSFSSMTFSVTGKRRSMSNALVKFLCGYRRAYTGNSPGGIPALSGLWIDKVAKGIDAAGIEVDFKEVVKPTSAKINAPPAIGDHQNFFEFLKLRLSKTGISK
jgi:hypothetical protein